MQKLEATVPFVKRINSKIQHIRIVTCWVAALNGFGRILVVFGLGVAHWSRLFELRRGKPREGAGG